MGLNNVTGKNLASTYTAIVRALGSREPALGPAVRLVIDVEKRVLLFESEPGVLICRLLHDLVSGVAMIGLVRGAIVVVALAEHDNIVAFAERVRIVRHRSKIDVRIVAGGLIGRRAVEVPLLEVLERVDLAVDSLSSIARATSHIIVSKKAVMLVLLCKK